MSDATSSKEPAAGAEAAEEDQSAVGRRPVLVVDFWSPICPVDRAPGAGGTGLLRDRAAHPERHGPAGQAPGSGDLERRTGERLRRRCPAVDPALFDAEVPVFGICYGFQAMAAAMGGTVERTGAREYGATDLEVLAPGVLFDGLPHELQVWMSHGDAVNTAPAGFTVTACSPGAQVAAFEDLSRRLAGSNSTPEVLHTDFGQRILTSFLRDVAGIPATWTTEGVIAAQVDAIAAQVGDERVICGLSGGVDSAVAAALVQRAVGDQLTCVFVDHGLLRAGEAEQVEQDFVAATGWR